MHVFLSLTLFLERTLPSLGTCLTLPPMRSLLYLFSALAAQGAKQGRTQGCSWTRLPPAREKALGPRGAGGPRCPCWGKATCGNVPADLPFLEQQTLQALLMQGLQLCPPLAWALPACCLSLGSPQCSLWNHPSAQPAADYRSTEFSPSF